MDKEILNKINILYVEDEEEVRTVTADIISGFVNNFHEASDGQEGLDLFNLHNIEDNEKEPFDIIITDINMPRLNGLEMIEAIRNLDSTIPIIITTAHDDASFLQKAINFRVRGYVSKPLHLGNLLDNITMAVEPKILREELLNVNKTLENKVKEKTLELRHILDSQNNMIIVFDDKTITNVNKPMLEFLDTDKIENLVETYSDINKLFVEEDGYFYSPEEQNWIKKMQELNDIDRVVKMCDKKNNIPKYFQVNISSFFCITDHYVVSFTDITDLKNYTLELQYKATHDNLTGLYNRQKLGCDLDAEIQRQKRYKHDFSLIMFDIDDFKKINDTYGHDVGDIVLKDISKIVESNIRSTDIAARWGGEEFMILLPETKLEDSIKLANKIKDAIANFTFEGVPRSVTISLGTSEFISDKDNKETLLKRVDIALYKAKENGKNQVVAL